MFEKILKHAKDIDFLLKNIPTIVLYFVSVKTSMSLWIVLGYVFLLYVISSVNVKRKEQKISVLEQETINLNRQIDKYKEQDLKFESLKEIHKEQTDKHNSLFISYSKFVRVSFQDLTSSLDFLYQEFLSKHSNKTKLKDDLDMIRALNKDARSLSAKQQEELKHVERNLPRRSNIE